MTWVDWVILVFLALGAWEGLRRGLLVGALTIASYAVAWIVAVRLSVPFGTFLDHRFDLVSRLQAATEGAAPAIGGLVVKPVTPVLTRVVDDVAYVLIILGVLAAASLVLRALARLPMGLLAAPNRLGGFLLGAARNALIVLIVWGLVAPYAVNAGPPISSAVDHSRLLAAAARVTVRLPVVGALLPVGRSVR
jgi:uncharacterized membrane protein required for colicin V production